MPLQDISTNDIMSSPAPTGRRKSGRAVKVPEKFQPDEAPVNAKRKRSGRNVESDASEVEDENEDSEEEEQSEEEEVPKPSRKKAKTQPAWKSATKKSKANGIIGDNQEDDLEATAHAIRLPARPRKSRKATVQNQEAEGLYGRRISALLEDMLINNS